LFGLILWEPPTAGAEEFHRRVADLEHSSEGTKIWKKNKPVMKAMNQFIPLPFPHNDLQSSWESDSFTITQSMLRPKQCLPGYVTPTARKTGGISPQQPGTNNSEQQQENRCAT